MIDNSQSPPLIKFEVRNGEGKPLEGTVSRKGAICLACATPSNLNYIRSEGTAGRMDAQLMAIVGEGDRRRIYLSPNNKHEKIAVSAKPEWKPEAELPSNPRNFNTPIYGINTFDKLFTHRQLVALNTFCDLVGEIREIILKNAIGIGIKIDNLSLNEDEAGIKAYADAIATYLAFAMDRLSDRNSTICSWDVSRDSTRNTFARQAIPMTWDYVEANPLSDSTGNFLVL